MQLAAISRHLNGHVLVDAVTPLRRAFARRSVQDLVQSIRGFYRLAAGRDRLSLVLSRNAAVRCLANGFILCAVSVLSISGAFAQNILANAGFETSPPTTNGNNIGYSVSPWTLTGGITNVVRVDGPGGVAYGSPVESGPQSDATLSGAGIFRHYLDISGSGASFYQSFTVPNCTNGATTNTGSYTLSGYFSTRDRLTATGTMELRSGTGLAGAAVAGSSVTVNTPVQVTGKTWTLATATVSLVPGQTYSYVVTMNDGSNFDEASVIPANLQCPAVALTKTTSSTPKQVGETLVYSFSAKNISTPAAIAITAFSLTDAKCATTITLQSATVTSDTTLQNSETQVYTCTSVPVTQAEYNAGSVLNNVTGSGTPSSGSLGSIAASLTTPVSRTADLSIVKSDGVSVVFSGSSVTYTVIATNNSVSAVTGAVVRDIVGTRVTCPGTNAVTITGNGVPPGSFTIANLTGAGITLDTLAKDESAILKFTCQVN